MSEEFPGPYDEGQLVRITQAHRFADKIRNGDIFKVVGCDTKYGITYYIEPVESNFRGRRQLAEGYWISAIQDNERKHPEDKPDMTHHPGHPSNHGHA